MVSATTLEVIIQVRDQLSGKIKDINNKLKNTGTTATTAMNQTKNATTTASNAFKQMENNINSVQNRYNNLKNTVTSAFNSIKQAITNSNPLGALNANSIAQPFKNAAETIRNKWQSVMQNIRSSKPKPTIDTSNINNSLATINNFKTKFNTINNSTATPKINSSGFNTAKQAINDFQNKINTINRINVNPRFQIMGITEANGKIQIMLKDLQKLRTYPIQTDTSGLNRLNSMLQTTINQVQKVNGTPVNVKVNGNGLAALPGQITQAQTKIAGMNTTLEKTPTRFQKIRNTVGSLTGSMSMLQGTIMSAFGVVGVSSLSQFTIGAAIARQKLNAVTTSITGSKAATEQLNKAISKATSGGVVGFTAVATATQQIAIKHNLTNAQLEKSAPLLNKIGTLAKAMGKDTSTATQWMAKAYDGLTGNFLVLKRQLGITKEMLLDNGWSGAASDVDGYTLALQKCLDKKPEMQEYLNSYEGQMERLKLSIGAAGRQIGEVFLPVLNTLLGIFLDINQRCPWLTTAIVVLAVAFVGVASAAMVLLPILEILTLEIGEVTVAEKLLNLVTLANPWVLLVVAIIAVIAVLAYLYTNVESVRKIMDKCAATVRDILVKAWENLQRILAPLYPTVEHLGQVFQRLAEKLGWNSENGGALEAVIWLLCKAFEAIVKQTVTWWQFLAAVLVPVLNLLINVISSIINFAITLAEAFSLLAQGDFSGFITTLLDALSTLTVDVATYMGEFVIELLNSVGTALLGANGMIGEWLMNFIMTGVNGAIAFVTGFIGQLMQLPTQVYLWLLQTLLTIRIWAGNTVNEIRTAAMNAVNGFISYISGLPQAAWNYLNACVQRVINFKNALVAAIREAARNAVQGFADKIKEMPQKMLDELNHIKDNIVNFAGKLWQAAKDLAWNAVMGFISGLDSHSPGIMARTMGQESDYIISAMENNIGTMSTVAGAMADSIVTGFGTPELEAPDLTSLFGAGDYGSTPIANEGDKGITPDLNLDINPVMNTDTTAVAESFAAMNEIINPILAGLTTNMNNLGLTSQTNTAQLMLNNQQITLSYQQLQMQVSQALSQIQSRNITAWNNIKSTTISNLNNILSSTKNVTTQMINAWQTMKNSIIQAANDIKSQSEQRFNSLWSTIKTFYQRIQHPGGAGSPTLQRRGRSRGGNAFTGFANAVNNRLGNRDRITRQSLNGLNSVDIEYILPRGVNSVSSKEFMRYYNAYMKTTGAGGWSSVVKPNVNWIRDTTNKWDTAPPTIVRYRTSHGFKVGDFEHGEPQISFNEFRQIAEDVFNQCDYLFYMDSDWYGSWQAAARAGLMNCSDGTDFLLNMAWAFGLSGTKVHGYWNDIGHFWANIEGHKMDTTGWMNRGTWTPSASHSGPVPNGLRALKTSENDETIISLLTEIKDKLTTEQDAPLQVEHKGKLFYEFKHNINGELPDGLTAEEVVQIMDAHVEDSQFLKLLASNREFIEKIEKMNNKINGERNRFS